MKLLFSVSLWKIPSPAMLPPYFPFLSCSLLCPFFFFFNHVLLRQLVFFSTLLICDFAYSLYLHLFFALYFRDGNATGMVVRHRLHPLH